jgi:hemerythrin-like domain-containing protein
MKAKTKSRNGRTARKAAKPKARDAIAILTRDHEEARTLLRELSESPERAAGKRGKILAQVGPALWVHMQIEEEIYYPAFEAAQRTADDEVQSFEARAAHATAKAALTRLESCDLGSTELRAMAKVVHDLIDHHAEEEESEMFPRARKLLGAEELMALGEQLAAKKEQLLATGSFRRGDELAKPARASKSKRAQAA